MKIATITLITLTVTIGAIAVAVLPWTGQQAESVATAWRTLISYLRDRLCR